jgi:hypothetical protein
MVGICSLGVEFAVGRPENPPESGMSESSRRKKPERIII